MNKIKMKKLQPGLGRTAGGHSSSTIAGNESSTPGSTPNVSNTPSDALSLPITPVKPAGTVNNGSVGVTPTKPRVDNAENVAKMENVVVPLVQRRRPKIILKEKNCDNAANKVKKNEGKPRSVDVFNIINQIGEGTYGQVYKARDTDNW